MINLFFNWGIADYFGWGVYGFNLLYWGLQHPEFRPFALAWPPKIIYPIDPLTESAFEEAARSWSAGVTLTQEDVVLSALDNQITREPNARKIKEIGVIFFEANPLPDRQLGAMREFHGIIAGSSWNQRVLEEQGIDCRCVIQGVDTELFRPLPKRLLKDRFVVFSGGKLEYRKGQDQVLRAFAIFAANHPDAVLLTAWRSPWEKTFATTVNLSGLCVPLVESEDVHQSIVNWARANGIRQSQFIEMGAVANRLMPEIFREVDFAVFPSRCEGGTNLVAMEALSCGIKCAISSNTGHLDIVGGDNCVPLRQRPVPVGSVPSRDWGESDIDELVAVLEDAYQGKIRLEQARIRSSVADWTWESSINRLWEATKTVDMR